MGRTNDWDDAARPERGRANRRSPGKCQGHTPARNAIRLGHGDQRRDFDARYCRPRSSYVRIAREAIRRGKPALPA